MPLGLCGAVSPVILTEQTLLLAGPDGGRAGVRYAAGVVLTTLVVVVAIVLFGRAVSLPTRPHLDATLDLVLGLVLVNVAVLVVVSGRRRGGSPSRKGGDDRSASGSRKARAAFAFGVFAMATNVTTLALIAPAAKEISRTDVDVAAEAALVLVLVGLVSMPAWLPVVLTRVAPGPSQRALTAVRNQIARRRRGFTVGLLGAAGLFFIGRGLIRLLG
jgi:threonine/homoserine/homoserine lactone efflux protein